MDCVAFDSSAVAERTAQGYRRFRCWECGKRSNERSASLRPFDGGPVLPHWIIEWDRFGGTSPHPETTLPGRKPDVAPTILPARLVRKLDTSLAPTLGNLPNEGNELKEGPSDAELEGLRRC
ncbi:hypothetical protein GCM10011504_49240 [Siccirubricoccus deserti]|uniref:Uncharacterized protein n=1 Tax=Siccirubricoccus deserti TaxID=2013562 RepID=A0A9X0UEZ2_9PROT|nr:hypothetical protein [Siccirubricoccus deserti]MBC4018414.1 hypothetical protein [Siccirubricoccus deserti]GGC65382.1 hypothetical protein GCM10011504_49240 [Siccirubricoccus deserti]